MNEKRIKKNNDGRQDEPRFAETAAGEQAARNEEHDQTWLDPQNEEARRQGGRKQPKLGEREAG